VRLGLFGGTFDPPHIGHFLVAVDAVEALGLDRLVFIPTGEQPLKRGRIIAPARDRLAMTELLVAGDPRFEADAVEIDRGGLSYTVDTLTELAVRAPADERFFLLGADAWRTFPNWRDPAGVARLATVVVMQRGGEEQVTGAPRVLETRRVEVSSTEIRARVRAGRSIRGFVPDTVLAYIERTGLYREDGHAETTD
jgi:nicotinate-nucleotide adenylyltransferase